MRRSTIFMALAMVAAFLAATTVYSALKNREAQIKKAMVSSRRIVVAARDLPLGTRLTPLELKLARWPSNAVPPGAFSDPQAVVGRYVQTPLVAEEPIVAAKLVSTHHAGGMMSLLIPPGMRAVSMPVDEVSDVAGFVMPQTHVDVLVAMNGDQSGPALSKIVVQNVEVLAVAQEITKQGDKPQVVKVVTLLVTPRQAETLTLASREGTLRLAIRGYADTKVASVGAVSVPAMLGESGGSPAEDAGIGQSDPFGRPEPGAAHRSKGPEVEVWRDGKSAQPVSFEQSGALAMSASPKIRTAADRRGAPRAPLSAQWPADARGARTTAGQFAQADAAQKAGTYVPQPKTIEVP